MLNFAVFLFSKKLFGSKGRKFLSQQIFKENSIFPRCLDSAFIQTFISFRIVSLWIWICHSMEWDLQRTADTPIATLHPLLTAKSHLAALPWPQVVVERKMRKILHRCNLHFFIYSTENWGLALDFIAVQAWLVREP